jgi:hypothetical protein
MSIQCKCTVIAAGPMIDEESTNLVINIMLKEKGTAHFGGKNLWFAAERTAQREMLATALASITSGIGVWVSLDNVNPSVSSGDSSGTVQSIYLTVS